MRCLKELSVRAKPAIPSSAFVPHRRHPSRLPCGALRAALTGPVGDAEDHLEEGMAGCSHRLVVNR
jgi:hypothetical protein